MRKLVMLLALVALTGCTTVVEPPVRLEELDFGPYASVHGPLHFSDDTIVRVTYEKVGDRLVVVGIEPVRGPRQAAAKADTSNGDQKDGDDETEVTVSWGELKVLYQ